MNCPNCGAAMQLTARGYYVCGHCGTNAFPGTIDRDGIRIIGPGETPLPCCSCQAPLVRAMLDEYQIDYCEKCRGVLVPRRSFAEVVRRRRAWAAGPPVTPIPPEAKELRRKINCPKCAAQMTTDWYYGPGNIILDRCVPCDLVWLDYGELKQVIDAPGVDRGTRDL